MRLRSLHEAPLRVQVVLMFASVAFVAGVLTYSLVRASVDVALVGMGERMTDQVRAQLGIVIGAVVVCTIIAALGAATFLRSSIRRAIEQMQEATTAIAGGGFEHRVASTRRDELGVLAADIDAMAERLQGLDQSRQQLLASVSHELRTPLTVIRCQSYALSRHERDPAACDRMALIESECERLATLIDDLLTAATLRVATLEIEPIPLDLAMLLQASRRRFDELAGERDVVLRAHAEAGLPRVRIDERRMSQVLNNLVGNALQHAPAWSTVEVAARHISTGVVRVSVRNGGPGIPTELMPQIFEPFVQGPAPTGAVGLGLSIARDLVRAHDSDLQVESVEGRTEFWFDLTAVPARNRLQRSLRARFA